MNEIEQIETDRLKSRPAGQLGGQAINSVTRVEIESFFQNLSFRFQLWENTKREVDLRLAADFNVFDYMEESEPLLSRIIADLSLVPSEFSPTGCSHLSDLTASARFSQFGLPNSFRAVR
jgi:hypothetical protein